jgi:signal transduction histidine kinase
MQPSDPAGNGITEPPVSRETATASPRDPSLAHDPSLLASVCHDLKEPLSSIVMGTSFLRRTVRADDAASRKVLDVVHRAAERMGQVITSFADLARLESGELLLNVARQDAGVTIAEAFDEVRPEATALGIPVSLHLDPELPIVPCDRERLRQGLLHLFRAALRATPDGARVDVLASPDGAGGVHVEVTARRGSAPGSKPIRQEGGKPALAIARGLMALHGASLTIAITGDGDMATWSFTLPGERS